MTNTDHMKEHLAVVTQVNNEEERVVPVEDPFHTTNIRVELDIRFGLWDRLKILFLGKHTETVRVRVKVRADDIAIRHWFHYQPRNGHPEDR
jgi:hypothetical protein